MMRKKWYFTHKDGTYVLGTWYFTSSHDAWKSLGQLYNATTAELKKQGYKLQYAYRFPSKLLATVTISEPHP